MFHNAHNINIKKTALHLENNKLCARWRRIVTYYINKYSLPSLRNVMDMVPFQTDKERHT